MQSIKIRNPRWPNKATYFLTDSTFLHYSYFRNDLQKQIVLNQFKKLNQDLKIPISDYSISSNHYHLKFYLEDSRILTRILQLLRGGISYEYRKKYDVPYKEMWQTRKIILVSNAEIERKIMGYICGNLLKHKEVSTFEELKRNRFSSFGYKAEKYGEQAVKEAVLKVINIDEDSFGGIDEKFLEA